MDNGQMPKVPEGALGTLLGNPQIAEKLPRIMEALGPVLAEMKAENAAGENAPSTASVAPETAIGETAETQEDAQDVAKAVETAVARPLGRGEASGQQRRALLSALSPYLSQERRAALDTILKMSSLLDLISEVL
ncbi:MAG: hypothetical protein IJS44_00600 [Clostridia bacterium]|nr:hypothetical protein [Clostridia bacterium]